MRALTREEKAATLKRLRLAAGLGQRRLARASKLEVQVIAAMEHGRLGIGLRRARRIAKALGVDVTVLLFADPVPVGERNYEAVGDS
jgi:transcriptional regulator with XRE-family HTH domain